MPKKLLATTIILATILALVIGIQAVEVADANPLPPPYVGGIAITIQSPSNSSSFSSSSIPVVFNATANSFFYLSEAKQDKSTYWNGDFFYVLDGKNMTNQGIKIENVQMREDDSLRHIFTGQFYITNLAEGYHTITIYWGVQLSSSRILNASYLSQTSQFYFIPSTKFPMQELLLFAFGITFIALLSVSLYFKRRKRKP
jgi:hypothetical protein